MVVIVISSGRVAEKIERMVHLFASIGGLDLEMLGEFLRHYRRAGISSILIAVNQRSLFDKTLNKIYKNCEDNGANVVGIDIAQFSTLRVRENRIKILQHLPKNDWVVQADLDEFQCWPGGKVSCTLDQHPDANCVLGCLVDRVSIDGALAEYDPLIPIWRQYPLECDFTREVMIGCASKVLAYRAGCAANVTIGQHQFVCDSLTTEVKAPDIRVPVAHFKWTKRAIEKLQNRINDLESCGSKWAEESKRGLEFIRAHGGIPIGLPGLNARPGDTVREVRGPGGVA